MLVILKGEYDAIGSRRVEHKASKFKREAITGARDSEYGEKQNDYRINFRARYYF